MPSSVPGARARLAPWHRAVAWLAVAAVLLGALAPVVSQVLAAAGRLPPVAQDFCGLPSPGNTVPGDAPIQVWCPYCAVHAGSFALPATAVLLLLYLPGRLYRPQPPRTEAVRSAVRGLPRSRGPPSSVFFRLSRS